MTVNTLNITSGPYTGNDLSDTYSYTFRVNDKTQLSVYETTDAGVETLLTVDTDYTVTDIGVAAGGTVIRTAGNLPANYTWYIRSNYIENQLTAFSSQGAFFPDIHENQMDHLTFLIQQILDYRTRSMRLSDSVDIDGDFTIDDDEVARASKFLNFDDNGDLTLSTGPQLSTIDGIYDNVALMKADSLAAGLFVQTRGYYSAGDGGAATYLISVPVAFDGYGDHQLTNLNIAVLQISNSININSFGAKGDDATDDTVAIQAAIDSGVKNINGNQGDTYIVDGGLTSSIVGQHINFTGSTIKLKNNATTPGMLTMSGVDSSVTGGTWDGNKANGNIPGDLYTSYNVALTADRCSCNEINSINTAGMAIKLLEANDLSAKNNTIRDVELYGIFGSANTQTVYRNVCSGNNIDCSAGGDVGQGILLTSNGAYTSGFSQENWQLSNNNIVCAQGAAIPATAQPLAVRGHNGIVSNNVTRYGSMGFSEGGDNTVISGNAFLDLQGTYRYGVEPSGVNVSITGNTITNALYGVSCSAHDFDNLNVSGNNISCDTSVSSYGIRLQMDGANTGNHISIVGNTMRVGLRGVVTKNDIANLNVSGNTIKGPGTGTVNSRGVYLETPPLAANVFVSGNIFDGFERPVSVYDPVANTFTDLYAVSNHVANTNGNDTWNTEGLAIIGDRVVCAWGSQGKAAKHYIDQGRNVFIMWSTFYNNPEGSLTAGIGSVYHSLNTGQAYKKLLGTGNTGWAIMGFLTSTTTLLADITAGINTDSEKVAGLSVFNTTTNKPVWAVSNADGGVWVDATGATAHTPV